jgi:SRSO17 transposase
MLCTGHRFRRVEPRRRARAFVLGLLAGLPRKNCWTIAEHAGEVTPSGMQHLLSRACWDADGVRDDVRGYVVERLGHPGAVLVVDETGDVKKDTATAGVQRHYTGTAGRVENAQVAVYLTYAAPDGHALIADPARCRAAGIPQDAAFSTKPTLAWKMVTRTLDAGVPAAWAAGDEVYGADPGLRAGLEERHIGYVLAVARNHIVPTAAGPLRADALAAKPASTSPGSPSSSSGC